jgi:apolipoprotein N-acyltransferase
MAVISNVQPTVRTARQAVLHFSLGVVLSALSGVLLLLSFPRYGLWPLAWVALLPALFAQYRLLPQRFSSLAGSMYTLFWLGPWLARNFGNEAGPFFPYLGILIAIACLFINIERKFHELTGFRWFVLYGMFLWVGMEMIRALSIPMFGTGAFIGYTQATQAWLFQPVAIFSIYGFNFVIILVNYALALGLLAWYDRKYPSASVRVDESLSKRWLAVMGAVLAVWIVLSLVMLNGTPKDIPTVRVATLRPGFPRAAFLDKVNTDQVRFDTFASQTRQAAARGAQVLVTPEMMFAFDPREQYTEEFKAIARETKTHIFIAYAVVDQVNQTFRNETVLLSPAGEFSEAYAKNHPMPGEPLSPGAGVYPVFDTPFGKMGVMICHDADYTDVSRKLAVNGAQLIAIGFNEGRGGSEQIWTLVTFRAVENHAAIVATGDAYFSTIIDKNGNQIFVDTNYDGSPLVTVADVPMGSGPTIYSSIGDVPGWVALAGLAFFVTFMLAVRIRDWKAVKK